MDTGITLIRFDAAGDDEYNLEFTNQEGIFYDMAFLVINIATRDGWMLRITDALELAPPEYVQLIPVAEASVDGPTIAEASEAEITPQAWYDFQINPYPDIVSLNTDMAPWLWGVCNIPGGHHCYPAPVLGYTQFGKFYFAVDYIDGEGGCVEMTFLAGTIATRDGSFNCPTRASRA